MTKSERWKPEMHEEYWHINEYFYADVTENDGYDIDKERIAIGNCFKAEAEAEAALVKVKALLLSLHSESVTECNQLPKLTAEVFDRPDCPEWAKYAAINGFGSLCFFDNRPVIRDYAGNKYWGVRSAEDSVENVNGNWDTTDWMNSLIERPTKLPSWVEVGGYVYDARNGYGKIVSGSVKSCRIEFNGGAGDFVPEAFAKLKQANLRPYNAEELENLVGKVLETTEQTALVIGFIRQSSRIVCGLMNNYLSGESLLDLGVTIAGKPAGVLEHLEDGEWVE